MNINELAAMAAEEEDCTVAQSGGDFQRELPEAGACLLRFREYLELGLQKTASKKYPKKKPALMTRWVFELTTPKHVITSGEGEDAKTFGHVISIQIPKSLSDKSNYFKLFKMLNYKGEAKHPAQLLGQPYLAEVIIANDEDGKPKWANLRGDNGYTFRPPRKEDPLAGTVEEIPVPEMLGEMKLFLWNNPTKETWDSLFIDGEFTKEVDGKEVTTSKNWIQNKILDALDYEGSKLQEMLVGKGESLDDLPTEEPATEEPTEAPAETPVQDDELDALLGV